MEAQAIMFFILIYVNRKWNMRRSQLIRSGGKNVSIKTVLSKFETGTLKLENDYQKPSGIEFVSILKYRPKATFFPPRKKDIFLLGKKCPSSLYFVACVTN
jgi:hypothetical protein